MVPLRQFWLLVFAGAVDSEAEWREQAMSSIKQFKVQSDTNKTMMEQLVDYYTKNIPREVRENMCKVLNQCENRADCIVDLKTELGYRCQCPDGYFTYNCNYS